MAMIFLSKVMIDGKPWLSWSINARDIDMVSYLCRRRQKDVADYIITDEKLSGELLKLLLSSDCPRYTFTDIYRRHIHKTYYGLIHLWFQIYFTS